MSSKHRYNLRRQDKKFIETFPDQIEWQWHTHLPDLDALCKRMEEVAAKTYQRGLGAGFVNDEIHRRRLSEFARRDLIRIMLLTVNGQPKAYWLGTAYNGVFHSTSLGYTPDITDFGVGNLMLFKLVDRLVADGFTALDFGSGDAEYKDRFSDQSQDEADATLYSGRFRSRCIQDYVAAIGKIDQAARTIIARMGALNRLKRKWRDRLAAKAALKP
jgi:CelD/BcsL family acetyltransferase involved in cellulose biosynthesis